MSIDQRLRDSAQQLRSSDPDRTELGRTWQELMLTAESRSRTRRARRLVAVPVLVLAGLLVLFVGLGPDLLPDRSAPPGDNSPTISGSPSPTPKNKATQTVHHFARTQLTATDWPGMRADLIQLYPQRPYPSSEGAKMLRSWQRFACNDADLGTFDNFYDPFRGSKGMIPSRVALARLIVTVHYGCPAGDNTLIRWLSRSHPPYYQLGGSRGFHQRAVAYLQH